MTENEKLRALLAEARGALTAGCYCGNSYCTGTAINKLRDRIDAALAESVVDDDIDADLRMHKEDRLRLRTENLRLTRERDEARAEVERLRSLKPIGTYSLDWNHEQERMTVARAAYQRGAEAMREAAASCVGGDTALLQTYRSVLEGRIRDLPVPEDKS